MQSSLTSNGNNGADSATSVGGSGPEQTPVTNNAGRARFSKLGEACLRLSEKVDAASVLQEVIDSACALTGAKYGALLTQQAPGGKGEIVFSGACLEEFDDIDEAPEGNGLLGYLNEFSGPLHVSDIASHPRSAGFPPNHPAMENFLGMPILRGDERVGNIYLTDKADGSDFTAEDEETIELFAAQAAAAISTARRYDEERASREDLATLLNISPVGMVVFDAITGDIVSINPEVGRLFGGSKLSRDSWERGLEALSYRRSDGREFSLAELPLTRALQSGETVRAEEMVISLPDGRAVTTLVNAAPIYSERGEIRSVVVAFQDMTPLQDVERMRGEFLGLVSQELRTPLSTIKGSVGDLKEVLSDEKTEALHLVRVIEQQTDLMRNQINSLVELTNIQAGTLPLAPQPLQLTDLLDDATAEFRRGHFDLRLDTSIPKDLPPVLADRQRIAQVLRNLLAHVSQHACMDARTSVQAVRGDAQVTTTVRTVCGNHVPTPQSQSAQFLRRIYADNITQARPDEGLALAICRGIVEAHGGRIWADEGKEGEGAVLTFTLPSCDDLIRSESDGAQTANGAHSSNGQKPKVLVGIEDTGSLAAVRRVLSRGGYRPIPTFDMANIEELATSERPEVLLLDLSARIDEAQELVRRIYDAHGLPIIVLANKGGDEQIVKAFEMGAEGYIIKPFSATELLARVEASLRKRAADRALNSKPRYCAGELEIDYDSHIITLAGRRVQLTATEYKLLIELSSNAGRVLTQDELLQRIWGPEYRGEAQLLRAYVKTLRQKLGDNARKPSYIFTEHGIGYRMPKP